MNHEDNYVKLSASKCMDHLVVTTIKKEDNEYNKAEHQVNLRYDRHYTVSI